MTVDRGGESCPSLRSRPAPPCGRAPVMSLRDALSVVEGRRGNRLNDKASNLQFVVQVYPPRVDAFNQLNLPPARPGFDLLLS
ncbi:MAG: hypothetical protein HW404_1993 [Anaerolineales bacterium]|nr:hypothetical protein [Anaerolineales bacterium]